MFNKSFIKPMLILCAILAFAGIVWGSYTDYYERGVDRHGEGFIYWEDANIEKTAQAQATVSKYSHWILPFVYVNEYTHCKNKENDSTGNRIKATTICIYIEKVRSIQPHLIKAKIRKPMKRAL